MKAILILSLVCLTFSVWGPVDKIKNSNSEHSCVEYNYYGEPDSLSDCVDLSLNYQNDNGKVRYADRCCFVRYQNNGAETKMCFPLKEELYMDIVESKRQLEDVCSRYNNGTLKPEGKRWKIYQFDSEEEKNEPIVIYDDQLAGLNCMSFWDNYSKFIACSDDKKIHLYEYGINVAIRHISSPTMHSIPYCMIHPNGKFF